MTRHLDRSAPHPLQKDKTVEQVWNDTNTRLANLRKVKFRRKKIIDKLIVMYECEYYKLLQQKTEWQKFLKKYSRYPNVVSETMTEGEMCKAILDEKIQGFVRCSLSCSRENHEKFKNFAGPIFKRVKLVVNDKQHDTIVGAFSAENIVISTQQFCYLVNVLGINVTSLEAVLSYYGTGTPFVKFAEKLIKMRQEAAKSGDKVMDSVSKAIGNHCFGYLLFT